MKNKNSLYNFGLFGGIISIFIWSLTPLVVTVLKQSVNAVMVAFLLQLVGLSASVIFTLWLYFTKYDMSFLKEIPVKAYKWIILAGIVESLSYITFYFAIQYGGAMQATVVHYLWPLILIVLSQTFITNTTLKLNFYQWFLVFLAIIGSYFVITGGINIFTSSYFKLPLLWAFASAFLSAMNSYSYKKFGNYFTMTKWQQHAIILTPRVFIQVIVAFIVVLILKDYVWQADFQSIALIFYLGIFTLFLSHIGFSYALHNMSTEPLSIATYATPALSLIWVAVFLHQNMPNIALSGAGLVFVCVVLAQSKERYLNTASGLILSVSIISLLILILPHPFIKSIYFGFANGISVTGIIFSIIIGFTLSRLHLRNKETDIILIKINNNIQECINQFPEIKSHMIEIAKLVLFIDANNSINKDDVVEKINKINGIKDEIVKNFGLKNNDIILKTFKDLDEWIYIRNIGLSLPEWFAIISLGFILVLGIITSSAQTWFGHSIALLLSVVITILVISVHDYEINRLSKQPMYLFSAKQSVLRKNYGGIVIPEKQWNNRLFPLTKQFLKLIIINSAGESEEKSILKETVISKKLIWILGSVGVILGLIAIIR
ncbi:MAG: DMT family transporter [Candidatus Acididesulfobacter diazotrophicus]|jgi:drug/metabolite transporter (DMT)-like permease|uniref:DMT family transporter n=1 Tax=Candidatus Acididesulfobacter diazotrophicus TaxID=2597226 RepID=A0A519BJQ9_9DELT|nr:MAG: DMT family transporter [Candidatus Acididesulfobacter diazotrophicus]